LKLILRTKIILLCYLQSLNEDLSKSHNARIMSNNQYIANTNRRLKMFCDTYKQTLLDYSSKHHTMISICAKEWKDKFEQSLHKVHNQQLAQVENVTNSFIN
jgi:hypothetical protein